MLNGEAISESTEGNTRARNSTLSSVSQLQKSELQVGLATQYWIWKTHNLIHTWSRAPAPQIWDSQIALENSRHNTPRRLQIKLLPSPLFESQCHFKCELQTFDSTDLMVAMLRWFSSSISPSSPAPASSHRCYQAGRHRGNGTAKTGLAWRHRLAGLPWVCAKLSYFTVLYLLSEVS